MGIHRACSPSRLKVPILLLLLGQLLQPLSIQASEFREGLDAYLDGDYETALALWGPLGERGNGAAQYSLGTLYESGRGVPQDYQRAAKWFRLAAEQGHAAAQFSLGNAYHQGHGVSRDSQLAKQWWLKAAARDFVPAQLSLANLYQSGGGIPRNEAKAQDWYRRAAKNGSQVAREQVDRQRQSLPRRDSLSLALSTQVTATRPARDLAPPHAPGVRREAWLLRQEPSHYALQLAAGGNEQNIKAFINRNDLSDQVAYFRSRQNGDDWYCLLYGAYPDYDQARQALAALPSRLRRSQPWVRQLSSVQKSITETRWALSE